MINETFNTKRKWWWSQRCRYNKGLFAAGAIAFFLYSVLGEIIVARYTEFEETIFEMAFQGGCYLFLMAAANILYTLGSIVDILFNRYNNQRFRQRLFAIGYCFSFAAPILLILSIMTRFLIFGKQSD
jgi:hypothetical protein